MSSQTQKHKQGRYSFKQDHLLERNLNTSSQERSVIKELWEGGKACVKRTYLIKREALNKATTAAYST